MNRRVQDMVYNRRGFERGRARLACLPHDLIHLSPRGEDATTLSQLLFDSRRHSYGGK